MSNYFIFDGTSSDSFGLHIESKQIYDAPERDMSYQAIPGRNGDLIMSNKRFNNVIVSYTCFFKTSEKYKVAERMREIKGWLYSHADEYTSLTDSYDLDDDGHLRYTREAVPSGSLSIDEQFNQLGSFTISFNCKPYKYSLEGASLISLPNQKSGESAILDNPPITVVNPEAFECLPTIWVNCQLPTSDTTPYLSVTNSNVSETQERQTWNFTASKSLAVTRFCINCEDMTITDKDDINLIKFFTIDHSTDGFPIWKGNEKLTVTFNSLIDSVEIYPHWRTL